MADDEQQLLMKSGSEQQPLIAKRGPSRGLVLGAVFGAALLLGAAVSARGGAAQQSQALRAAPAALPQALDADAVKQSFVHMNGRRPTRNEAAQIELVSALKQKEVDFVRAAVEAFAQKYGRAPTEPEVARLTKKYRGARAVKQAEALVKQAEASDIQVEDVEDLLVLESDSSECQAATCDDIVLGATFPICDAECLLPFPVAPGAYIYLGVAITGCSSVTVETGWMGVQLDFEVVLKFDIDDTFNQATESLSDLMSLPIAELGGGWEGVFEASVGLAVAINAEIEIDGSGEFEMRIPASVYITTLGPALTEASVGTPRVTVDAAGWKITPQIEFGLAVSATLTPVINFESGFFWIFENDCWTGTGRRRATDLSAQLPAPARALSASKSLPAPDGEIGRQRKKQKALSESCVSPTTEWECMTAALASGLSLGGAGYSFAGAYGSGRGCYTYTSNPTYVGIAYWSTSGDPTNSNPGSGLARVDLCSLIDTGEEQNVPGGCSAPTAELTCLSAVLAAGLSPGGCGYDFAGDYGSGRGCYTYASGDYAGCGYWSTSGDPTNMNMDGGREKVLICEEEEDDFTPGAFDILGLPPPAESCTGWDCDIENQMCPQGVDGAADDCYWCIDGTWTACETIWDDLPDGCPTGEFCCGDIYWELRVRLGFKMPSYVIGAFNAAIPGTCPDSPDIIGTPDYHDWMESAAEILNEAYFDELLCSGHIPIDCIGPSAYDTALCAAQNIAEGGECYVRR
jgi:hypothetical protein